MKYLFAAVYVLVLATQLPHVWSAYASIEAPGLELAQWTALGAAVAFELSTGVFTYRIVKGSRRRWTKRGLWFFIAASICANGQYYNLLPVAFAIIWPLFATVALPLALALFAEEFGAEVKREERRSKRTRPEPEAEPNEPEAEPEQPDPFVCPVCGRSFRSQAALNGHQNAHRRGES